MKCLSVEQCRSWLAPTGLTLDESLRLEEPDSATPWPPLYVVVENIGLNLPDLSRRLLDWMPAGRERLLIVSSWHPYPPDQVQIFETIRKGCGASHALRDTPGHLFLSTKDDATWYDDRPSIDVQEESVAMWLMGLMLEWAWEGYAFVKGCREIVRLGDGFVEFLGGDPARRDAAISLLGEFGLKPRDTFPWGVSH